VFISPQFACLAIAAVGLLAIPGCSAATTDVGGTNSEAYSLWPEDVPMPDEPVVERPTRSNDCFQPEGTYIICDMNFASSDALLGELQSLYIDAGFEETPFPTQSDWEGVHGDIVVQLTQGSSPDEDTEYINLHLEDRS
jgi:hypothetical protein